MLDASTLFLIIFAYLALLLGVAQLVEKQNQGKSRVPTSAWVYALSITLYCTSWTFYGSVGFAANSGLLYFAIYIGAILSLMFWWRFMRGIVNIKEDYHISSIADFISARYNRSQKVAALVTLIALLGILPYIALQLTAIIETFALLTKEPLARTWNLTGILICVMLMVFSIAFGARRLDPTERHSGIMVVLAIQAVVKLVAFLAVGIFVTYSLYDGLGDITQRIHWTGLNHLLGSRIPTGSLFMHWATLIVLGAASIQCLPRQFHVAVVENANERHLTTAAWLVPLYLVAISFFVIPIAAGGLMAGLDYDQADIFVLLLPQMEGQTGLSLLAFIGGFSAATGMVIVSSMTLSTMVTNHLMLPIIERLHLGTRLRPWLLQCRWLVIALIIAGAYVYARIFSDSTLLVTMGIISFAAVFQFVPAMFLGLIWTRGNRMGAILGLTLGLLTWLYTLVLPAMVDYGWVSNSLLTLGPWGLDWLRPERLFGLEGLSPLSHSLVWSLFFNLSGYLVGSWLYQPSKLERTQLQEFLATLASGGRRQRGTATGLDAYIQLGPKKREALTLLSQYMSRDKAEQEIAEICTDLRIGHKDQLTIIELLEFHRRLEHVLAGSIGAAGAHQALESTLNYSEREQQDLHAIYSHIMVELKSRQAGQNGELAATEGQQFGLIESLQHRIDQLQQELETRNNATERLEERLAHTDERLFEARLLNQKLDQEVKKLKQAQQEASN